MRSLGRGFALVLAGAFLLGVYKTHGPGAKEGPSLGQPTGTAAVVRAHQNRTPPRLVSVRTSSHGTFDRVVFTFAGPLPASRTEFVRSVRAEGSATPLRLSGFADLRVTFAAVGRDRAGRPTWPGATSRRTAYPSLRQVTLAGSGGGQTTFGLGLDHKVGFRVIELARPTRIVIDVAS